MDIVLAPDNNYAKHAAAVMASVLIHNQKDFVKFWILDGGISEENKSKISKFDEFTNYEVNFVKIDPKDFEGFPSSGYITIAMWYRLKIATLLPESVERCLYLDCDTIVSDSLEELFSIDMSGKYVGTIIDCVYEKFNKNNKQYFAKDYPYFNSGVLLINLERWRTDDVEGRIFKFIKANPQALKLLDQTILNITLQDFRLELPIKYNFQFTPKVLGESSYLSRKTEYQEALAHPAIIHFVGLHKPWKAGYNALHPHYKLYIDALSHTQWKISESEKTAFINESESLKGKVFRELLFKQIKRKPWWVFRKYFWQRIFL